MRREANLVVAWGPRHGSEGEDWVYADDAADGYDTLDWIADQDWCNQRVGMSGSSAGATTTFAVSSCFDADVTARCLAPIRRSVAITSTSAMERSR